MFDVARISMCRGVMKSVHDDVLVYPLSAEYRNEMRTAMCLPPTIRQLEGTGTATGKDASANGSGSDSNTILDPLMYACMLLICVRICCATGW
jgi:hypothetical protein